MNASRIRAVCTRAQIIAMAPPNDRNQYKVQTYIWTVALFILIAFLGGHRALV